MQIGDPRAEIEAAAVAALIDAADAGSAASSAWSPGRCTLVGEHVDYAGGLVLCIAVDLGIAVAVRYGSTPGFLVTSDGKTIHRAGPEPVGAHRRSGARAGGGAARSRPRDRLA